MIALLEGIRIALSAIWAQKLRSALTLLCVIIAILSIIAVVSVLDGMDQYVREEIAGAGANVFTLRRVDELKVLTDFQAFLDSLGNPRITLADYKALHAELTLAEYVDPMRTMGANLEAVASGRSIEGIELQGRGAEYPGIEDLDLSAGDHLSQGDVDQRREVIVLGEEIATTLFPDVDPLGQKVRLAGRHYEVIGVFAHRSNVLGQNRNLFAVVPLSALFSQFGAFRSISVQVKARSLESFGAALEEARTLMRVRHGLRPDRADDFNLTTAEMFLTFWEKISSGIFASLIGVVSITLVVGGIIIMNVMLVSVTERTREIGIRKALGARRGMILFQFLVESVTLTSAGGIVGIVLGFGAAFMVGAFTPLPYSVKPWSIIAALLIVFAVGVFFGLYPAGRAAKLQPVEALRRE
jgi:putative ABC transport system permease protein